MQKILKLRYKYAIFFSNNFDGRYIYFEIHLLVLTFFLNFIILYLMWKIVRSVPKTQKQEVFRYPNFIFFWVSTERKKIFFANSNYYKSDFFHVFSSVTGAISMEISKITHWRQSLGKNFKIRVWLHDKGQIMLGAIVVLTALSFIFVPFAFLNMCFKAFVFLITLPNQREKKCEC